MPSIQNTKTDRLFLRFLGSLGLAMILLAVIIVACAVGTVAESRFDTAVAQTYVYDAPWFLVWLLLLCVNLICAVLLRYPWKPHHTGFIITHAGIVGLFIGAMIGRYFGIEGSVTLFKGAQPVNSLVLNQTVFDVSVSRLGERQSRVLNLDVRPPTSKRPVQIKLKDIQVSLVEYAKELGVQTRVEKGATHGAPAVHLTFRSAMAPKPISQWLVLGDSERDTIQFGPAQIQFAPIEAGKPKTQELPLSVAATSESHSHETHAPASRERHFVFAKLPEMTMARVVNGQLSGIKAAFRFDPAAQRNKEPNGILALELDKQRFEFALAEILDREVPLPGTGWTLNRLKFLPDFRLENKEPVSVSDAPNNPAVVFEIAGVSASSTAAAHECDHKEESECDHTQQKACCPKPGEPTASPHNPALQSGLTIFYGADRKLRFASVAKNQKAQEGALEIGKEIPIGLADWQVRIDELIEHASVRDELGPLTEDGVQSMNAPGVLVQVQRGPESVRQWVASGTPAHLPVGNETLHLSFGRKIQPLDFSVALDDFEVERDEGTRNPAGFKSHVRFVDSKKGSSLQRGIWMNHPADYPDFPGVSLLGTAYKFSQASWNPNDLSQTTLQVVRDPGWSLKWIGSLLVCAGIFTMFYIKPYPRRNTIES